MSTKDELRLFPFFLMGTIHLLFIWQILFPAIGYWSLLFLIGFLAYPLFPQQKQDFDFRSSIFEFISFGLGLLLTLWLTIKFKFHPVLSSSAIGTLVALIPQGSIGYKPQQIRNLFNIQFATYAGSFAGMTSVHHLMSVNAIFTSILIGGLTYTVLKSSFNGLGGKLGSIGFGAVVIHAISKLL